MLIRLMSRSARINEIACPLNLTWVRAVGSLVVGHSKNYSLLKPPTSTPMTGLLSVRKVQLCSIISSVTGIGPNYLNGEDLTQASISQRMSWASRRNTSRLEDTA
ncbi:hypothetical protein GJ744_012288 [Endocarpon pusillum]|uniref:Uncharacterized protein n=1 Tax=Endocarpon pusillum TaxID=364733 RepID=A0A8H7AF85_9EURO|nr:hypothetical protein GJ744_012288 [Endocarpon pusillum]